MPDSFGFETPKEALARINNRFAEANARIAELGDRATPGAQAGQALANIFGRGVKKRLDTRRARRTEEDRLVEEAGMSPKEARALAKQNVPVQFQEVREATMKRQATGDAEELIATLTPHIGSKRARAAAMTVASVNLRRMGFKDEATDFALKAGEIRQAEDDADLAREQLKANIEGRQAQTEALDDTDISKLTDQQETLIAKLDTTSDPKERASLERQLAAVEGRIAKLNNISLSDADLANRRISDPKQDAVAIKQLDAQILDNRLAFLEETILSHKGTLASTAIGRWGAGTAEFIENYFGIPPGTYGADTLISDVNEIAGSAGMVAAKIRWTLTGAAMSAQEMPLLEPFLATPGESLSKMLAKIAVVRQYTQLDIATREAFFEDPVRGAKWLRDKEKEFLASNKTSEAVDERAESTLSTLESLIQQRTDD